MDVEQTIHDEVWKGTSYYISELKRAGVYDQLRHFNDVVGETRPPHPDANYGDPVLTDVILDGKKCDIYHSDHSDEDTFHRIFIHEKNN